MTKTTLGISSKKGIKVQNQATVFNAYTDIAGTLMARDYKGFGNQQMTAILETDFNGDDK